MLEKMNAIEDDPGQEETGEGLCEVYEDIFIQLRKFYIHLQSECRIPLAELATMISLSHITRKKGYALPTEIKKDMRLSRPAVSRTLTALEKKGYLIRRTGVSDHRNVELEITEKGENVVLEEKNRIQNFFGKVKTKMGQQDMGKFLYYMKEFFSCLSETIQE